MKGLKYLEIRNLSANVRPKLATWLVALNGMSQLKTLTLHTVSSFASSGILLPFDVERTVAFPSFTHLDISAPVRDLGLTLAHLVLPALTRLSVATRSSCWDGSDVQAILPYVALHAHGPQYSQPLQSALISGGHTDADMLAWTVPGIDSDVRDSITLRDAMLPARVALSVKGPESNWSVHGNLTGIFDAAMAALPLDNLVTLTAQNCTRLNKQAWLQLAQRWPLLRRVRLALTAAQGFIEMLLGDNGERECPLLPSLTKLVLTDGALSGPWTPRLCDTLMKRVEQGVPLEVLDLRTCRVTDHAVKLFSEIVVDAWGPPPGRNPRDTETNVM